MHTPFESREAGFTLIEVILAISILTVGLLAVASMQVSAIRGNSYADCVTEAAVLAQDKLEELMAENYSDVGSSNEQAGQYTVTWSVDPNGASGVANTMIIEVTVTGGELREDVVLTSVIMDPDA